MLSSAAPAPAPADRCTWGRNGLWLPVQKTALFDEPGMAVAAKMFRALCAGDVIELRADADVDNNTWEHCDVTVQSVEVDVVYAL